MNDNKNYIHGKMLQVPAHLNFGKFIFDQLKTNKDEIALENIDTKERLSYSQLTQYAVNVSAGLTKLGARRGDVIGVGCEKRIEIVPTVLGSLFTGAACTSYELQSGKVILKHKLSIAKPNYFICSKKFWNINKDILHESGCIKKFLTVDDAFESIPSTRDLIGKDVDVQLFEPATVLGQTDVALIMYSSGTTGLSKGVELTHLNCIMNSWPHDFAEISISTAFIGGEWFHNYDTFMTYQILASGKKLLFAAKFETESALRSINEHQVEIIFGEPSLVSLLAKEKHLEKYNLESLKIIYSRSSPLHKKTIDKVKQRFPNLKYVLQGYGMTEAGELTSESFGNKGPKSGSVGKASPGITLKVSDLETRKTVGPNERGEICLKGPVLMKGYIGMDLSNYKDDEGFFMTGDLGYHDEDGYFYIVGRLKEIINYDGYKVPPLELETILQLHPGVREAGVVGKPCPLMEELPTAFVVRQPGTNVTEAELTDYIAKEVDHYMQLKGGVKFLDELPKNPRGKILRQKLKDLL